MRKLFLVFAVFLLSLTLMATASGADLAPDTSITAGPAEGSRSATSTSTGFSFSGTGNLGATGYDCSLDGSAFASCSSPMDYSNLAAGSHTFRVRARDAAGNVDGTPAQRTWTVTSSSPPTGSTRVPVGLVFNSLADRYLQDTSLYPWMRDHYRGTSLVYDSGYDSARATLGLDVWDYKDAYAIYPSEQASHDAFIARHPTTGSRPYIPWGCAGGTCPQYAADVRLRSWRDHWISEAQTIVGKGYPAIHVDDANHYNATSDGNADLVQLAGWEQGMTDHLCQMDSQLPNTRLLFNIPAWWAIEGNVSAPMAQAIGCSDQVDIERAYNDPNLKAGSIAQLTRWVDYLHSRDKGAVHIIQQTSAGRGKEWALAWFLLTQDASLRDRLVLDGGATALQGTPDNWWSGWDLDPGAPLGPRTESTGVYSRPYAGGTVRVDVKTGQVTLPRSV